MTSTVSTFRCELAAVPADDRDAWVDRMLGIDEIPDDAPTLPRGCVPYLPCDVETLTTMIDVAAIDATDVFVDIGSGIGRAALVTHLSTGAESLGIEIQEPLVRLSRRLCARLGLGAVSIVQGDATLDTALLARGSVFFLYCPFSGEHLRRCLDGIASIAAHRPLRVCTVDLPLPTTPWLEPVFAGERLAVFESVPLAAG